MFHDYSNSIGIGFNILTGLDVYMQNNTEMMDGSGNILTLAASTDCQYDFPTTLKNLNFKELVKFENTNSGNIITLHYKISQNSGKPYIIGEGYKNRNISNYLIRELCEFNFCCGISILNYDLIVKVKDSLKDRMKSLYTINTIDNSINIDEDQKGILLLTVVPDKDQISVNIMKDIKFSNLLNFTQAGDKLSLWGKLIDINDESDYDNYDDDDDYFTPEW